jgi:hypoxanthine phosphoribosyltransferase
MIENQLVKAHDKSFRLMISAQAIAERVDVIGQQISEDYIGKKPILLAILNGAYMFAADLSRSIKTDLELTFIKLSSYKGTSTTGNVTTVLGLDTTLSGRHIIIVEDIVDTGKTLHNFLRELQKEEPASVEIAACFHKPTALQHPLSIKYLGFEIPDHFIIGYGLDYDGLGRNLPDVYELNE